MQNVHLRQMWSLNRSNSKLAVVGVNIGDGENCWPELVLVGEKSVVVLDHTAWQNLLKARPLIEEFFARKKTKLSVNLHSLMHDTIITGHISNRLLLCISQTVKGESYTRFMYIAEATLEMLFKIHLVIDHVFDQINLSTAEICAVVSKFLLARENGTEPAIEEVPKTCSGLSMETLQREMMLYEKFYDRE